MDTRKMNRRTLLWPSTVLAAWVVIGVAGAPAAAPKAVVVDDFHRPDEFYHGAGWETLNPGYWSLQGRTLRRRLHNRGDRARSTGFPFHYETHKKMPMPMDWDPSLPFGMIWRRDWKLAGNYTITMEATIRALPKPEGDPAWRQNQPGYAVMGICFGGETPFESWHGGGKAGDASWMAAWRDDGRFGLYDHSTDQPRTAAKKSEKPAAALKPGDRVTIELAVTGDNPETATVAAKLTAGSSITVVECTGVPRGKFTDGLLGIVCRGLLDFEVNRVLLEPGENRPIAAPVADLELCYPLGDTMHEVNGRWLCKFILKFASLGEHAEIRISDSAKPEGGWQGVPVAGSAQIINNEFRRNTAVVEATLPFSPAEKTMYYTVWKDGRDVTADPRTGFLGKKDYVGRLPQLRAPYRVCGLGGHAIHGGGPNLPRAGKFQEYWVHDQPTPDAYKYLEDYNFQILDWDDDVWYLELHIFPPSIDDAYKIVTITLGGPTTRWQMMRHWNTVNPGDHDHGMDDVKGPEQYIIRQHDDLGQDPEYMRRNFQMVGHLVSGDESPSGTDNPKRWRRWKMPNNDFSLVILDPRLWRTSQDTNIWDDQGWGHKESLYDRRDPTRTLLGEEQFAWLQEIIRTDSSPLICLSGINCMHPIFTGYQIDPETGRKFAQRDRVAADYAGWVTAGCDRVIELLGSRQGIVSVYGDIHLASIVRDVKNRFYECSFGPIGRSGSRSVKEDFGPKMTDYDGRPVEVRALYHSKYGSPDLKPREGPKHWNFLELHFDPRGEDPPFSIQINNLVDPVTAPPRGGGVVEDRASNTGRPVTCSLPPIKTLPHADVRFAFPDGRPIRGVRSLPDGTVLVNGLIDVAPGTPVVMTSFDGTRADSQVIRTLPVP